jgi:hypothetical protein
MFRVADPDPHYFGKLVPDPPQSWDSDLCTRQHQSQNSGDVEAPHAVDAHNEVMEAEN